MPDEPVAPGEYTGEGENPTEGHEVVEKQDEQYHEAEDADTDGMGPDDGGRL